MTLRRVGNRELIHVVFVRTMVVSLLLEVGIIVYDYLIGHLLLTLDQRRTRMDFLPLLFYGMKVVYPHWIGHPMPVHQVCWLVRQTRRSLSGDATHHHESR